MKTEIAQDAQIIFADAGRGVANEAYMAASNVCHPVRIIIDRAVSRHRKRIEGEVAAQGVFFKVAAKQNFRASPVGLDIFAQSCDLKRRVIDDHRHRAMLDAGRHAFKPACCGACDDRLWHSGGGEINLADRSSHEMIAHRPADYAQGFAIPVESFEQAA